LVLKSKQTRGISDDESSEKIGKGGLGKARLSLRLKPLFYFLATFSSGSIFQLVYNDVVFGNPLTFPEQLKNAGTNLEGEFKLSAAIQHAISYLISPYRGLLFFSPVLILGIYGLYIMSRDARRRPVCFLFVSLFLTVLVAYSSWTDWAGGLAYGPRFLILGLPYLSIPISVVLFQNKSIGMRAIFLYLFAISSLIEGMGSLTTALSVAGNNLLYQPFALNFPWFLQGKFDTWWPARIGANSSTSQLFGVVLFQSIWAIASYFAIKERGTISREYENGQPAKVVVPFQEAA